MASISQICIPTARGSFQEAQERRMCLMNLKGMWESPKNLRKSCCHRIKCTVTIFLAAFMWRRYLNSDTLIITTHKELEDAIDGTDIQVKSQMNDKCKVKMIRKELYNVKNRLCKGDRKNQRWGSLSTITLKKTAWYKKKASRIEDLFPFVSVFSFKLSLNLWWW